MTLLKILLYLFLIYFLLTLFIYFYQRKLLYHPSENNYLDESSLSHNIQKISIKSENDLIGWYYEKNKDYKTLLFFHGNAGKLDNRIYKLNEFSKLNLNYLIFAYRGFSGNEGNLSELGFYQDAQNAKEWLNSKGISDEEIILYGESLGTAIAIEIAKKNPFAGVILESPFTSMEILAQKYYPYFPVKLILKDKYKSIDKLNMIQAPIHVMHGRKDNIVPFYMGEEIFQKYNGVKSKYFNNYDDHMMDFNKDLIKSLEIFIKGLN